MTGLLENEETLHNHSFGDFKKIVLDNPKLIWRSGIKRRVIMVDEYRFIESLPYRADQPYHIFNIMNKFAIIVLEKHESGNSSTLNMWDTCEIEYDLTITDLFILINKDQYEDDFKLRCSQLSEGMHLQKAFHIQVGQNVSGGWNSGWKDWRRSGSISNILIGESDTDYIIQFIFEESFGNFEYGGFNEWINTITISKEPVSDNISSIIRRKETIIGCREMGVGASSHKEPLLEVVDRHDRLVQYETKEEVHKSGLLHRAFSIFLYDREHKTVLIQKREMTKYHSGGLWSNSCCSHKYMHETWEQSLSRCLYDELHLTDNDVGTQIKNVGKFYYFSDYGDVKEHEIDCVFIYTTDMKVIEQIVPNPKEIMDVKWMTIEEIDVALKSAPQSFTSWFSKAYEYSRSTILECFS